MRTTQPASPRRERVNAVKTGKLKAEGGFVSIKEMELPTDRPITFGRDRRRDVPIMSRRVSRDHAKIEFRNGAYAISDLGSKTGTYVNNKKITTTVLRHNDIIRIGDIAFRFVSEEAAKKPEAPLIQPPLVAPPRLAQLSTPGAASGESAGESEAAILTEFGPPTPTGLPAPEFTAEERKPIGQTLGGIRLIAPVARGRRTLVYKGVQSAKNRVVAVKILKPDLAKNAEVVRWFVTGNQQGAEVRHEDTITPLGGGRQDAYLYAFMPFMEKGDAERRFGGPPPPDLPAVKAALEALVHIARAMEFGQARNMLHLGLRPSKILFNESLKPKLIGLGFQNGPGSPGAETTPEVAAFFAPEQVSGASEVSYATDIFSLGATFYYMLSGRTPKRDHRQRIPSPKRENRLVPDSICRIIEKMLAPNPKQRYATYGQLIHDVRWALRGEAWPHV